MHYLIGDLQGCCDALDRLLDEIDFSPSRDHVHVLGDLVNRGPASLATLQRLRGLGTSATCLLGNHDLHLLAVAAGVRKPHRKDTLGQILASTEREAWLAWLRQCKLADSACGWLTVHAGVLPQWSAERTLALVADIHWGLFFRDHQLDDLVDRLNLYLYPVVFGTGKRLFDGTVPAAYAPWFEHPQRLTAQQPVAFGHWSTLGLINQPHLLALDTGCVWGGALTAVRVDSGRREVVQVPCAQAQAPG